MSVSRRGTLGLILLVAVLCVVVAAQPKTKIISTYTFKKTGAAAVECGCVATADDCSLKIFDALKGKQRHTWTMDVFGKEGEQTDVRLACYRKRDADKMGAGLCCNVAEKEGKPDPKELEALFGALSVVEK
jgi:hypothetical protein